MGYERREIGEPCLKIDNSNNDIPLICKGSYIVSKGYRKIAGDTCIGGIDLNPTVVNCPGKIKIWKIIIFLIGIFLVFIIFLYFICNVEIGFYLKQLFNKNKDRKINEFKNVYLNLNNDDDEFNPLNMS